MGWVGTDPTPHVTQSWPTTACLGTFAGTNAEEGFSLLGLLALEILMVISAIT